MQFNEAPTKGEGNILKFFRHFGLLLDRNESNGQLVGECPVCRKGKFFANASNGCWDCKVCAVSGNRYIFMQWFAEHWFTKTTEDDYSHLASLRNFTISIEVMQEFGLGLNRLTNEWLLPGWSQQKSYANLYSWRQFTDEKTGRPYRQVVSAVDMHHVLYGVHCLSQSFERPVWICEGHWDLLAWLTLLGRLKLRSRHDAVGLCGSVGFPKHSINMLNDRIVYGITDNDDSGRAHATKLTNLMASTGTSPREYKLIHWPAKFPNKYDVSDAIAGKEMQLIDQYSKSR